MHHSHSHHIPPYPSDESDSSRLHFEPVLRLDALTELYPAAAGHPSIRIYYRLALILYRAWTNRLWWSAWSTVQRRISVFMTRSMMRKQAVK